MKLPQEKTLWNWVYIGFGLILGVAVIGLMNFLNEYLNIGQSESDIFLESDSKLILNISVYYSGKIIAILTGCLTAGAIIKIARPHVSYISFIVVGLIFILLSLIDLKMNSYPVWYQVISILIPIPSVLIGHRLIKEH